MNKTDNIKETLFDYVTDTTRWFYWYHNPERLKKLYEEDHSDDKNYRADTDYRFTKRVWRFKEKTVTNKKGKSVVIEKNLADFFDAVLDEVRLKKANDFAEYALYISDNEDLAYFRNTVAKREIVADIDYNRQRDHAVHTLYNYLLGWYIFEHSTGLKEAFKRYFKENILINAANLKQNKQLLNSYGFNSDGTKLSKKSKHALEHSMGLVHEFADVWHITSLLHDIGYILEGGLSSASPDVEHLRVTNGSKIIHDYFNHYFWKSFEVDFRGAKNIAKILGVVVPDFRYSESLASIGDRLCDIGSCENIRKKLSGILKEDNLDSITQPYGLNREAFSIWKEHYKFSKNNKMEFILYVVERVYKNWMWIGADYGKRNLDHGVCSGLITLQAMTFFRELFWGFCRTEWEPTTKDGLLPEPKTQMNSEVQYFKIKQKEPSANSGDRVSKELFEHIRKEITRVPKRIRLKDQSNDNGDIYCRLNPDLWFKKILWATASSAIHSIVQKEEYSNQCKKHFDNEKLEESKIGFNDDPLAFLGVFVDILQEWDRYKVTGRGEVAFSGDEPLQSTAVYLYRNKQELQKSCNNKSCKNSLCKGDIDSCNDTSIYFTYPKGNNNKNWTDALNKTMKNCLKVEKMNYGLKVEGGIVEIVACAHDGIVT